MNDDVVRVLAPLVSLDSLSLGGKMFGSMRMVPSVTDEGMRALSQLTTLTYLDLSYCDLVTIDEVRV